MIIYRVDDRLIHGQVVENWLGTFKIKNVVVVSDSIVEDELRKNIMRFSTPQDAELDFVKVEDVKSFNFDNSKNYMVLFEGLDDVLRAIRSGLKIDKLNLGGIHYAKGRDISLGRALFLSENEKNILKEIVENNVDVYMQAIPQENKVRVGSL
jgi:mannose/fructose/N-acetylgalactosamine-specific phosphotransferase system component IIB